MYGKRPDSECQMACKRDSARKCGASWRNTVYLLPESKKPDTKTTDKHVLIFGKVDQ